MLKEIRSPQLRARSISFHSGLNVVLGDANATNSIGKSTALMIIDFVFGGDTFLETNADAITALGHHFYEFSFVFDGEVSRFRRDTQSPGVVFRCDDQYQPVQELNLRSFTNWLKEKYLTDAHDISFRAMVGLFSRIWPKPNVTNVRHPLHTVASQSASDCIATIIRIFDRYSEIEAASAAVAYKDSERKALGSAFKYAIVEKISKTQYSKNVVELSAIQAEVDSIKNDIARFSLNIREVVDRDLLDLKNQKDELLAKKLPLQANLQRTERNLRENKFVKSAQFESLREFFPSVNSERIADIELFHSSLATVLKKELQENQKSLRLQVETIDTAITELDTQISERLKNYDNPVALIERVSALSQKWNRLRRENDYYSKREDINRELSDLTEHLSHLKTSVLNDIQTLVNDEIGKIVKRIYGEESKAPRLTLHETNYSYQVVDDTGTGKAYSNLVVFDLAIFALSDLPILIHDSPLFKNVENTTVAKFISEYERFEKQSFISLDEIEKYGSAAATRLSALSVLTLDNVNVLYNRVWRREATN
ncbi:DUF2326 domain-containing protein [Caballeronia sp. ATUFL_M1_KS5A]|uniref:DUF2326 domain-containing protein n=1 Tax=Caballeronia sp. ATUFL_M1_KS5A TaxID=2921778 RepID=UPI002029711E|nr:DUF2326 domain-containing protein [Caballeronia sp. ATUFL_M1_KS5A]